MIRPQICLSNETVTSLKTRALERKISFSEFLLELILIGWQHYQKVNGL